MIQLPGRIQSQNEQIWLWEMPQLVLLPVLLRIGFPYDLFVEVTEMFKPLLILSRFWNFDVIPINNKVLFKNVLVLERTLIVFPPYRFISLFRQLLIEVVVARNNDNLVLPQPEVWKETIDKQLSSLVFGWLRFIGNITGDDKNIETRRLTLL